MKIVMSKQAANAIDNQEDLDAITSAITQFHETGTLPEGVEITQSAGLSEDDIMEILAEYMHLNDADFKRLHEALKEQDVDVMIELMTQDQSSH